MALAALVWKNKDLLLETSSTRNQAAPGMQVFTEDQSVALLRPLFGHSPQQTLAVFKEVRSAARERRVTKTTATRLAGAWEYAFGAWTAANQSTWHWVALSYPFIIIFTLLVFSRQLISCFFVTPKLPKPEIED